MSVISHQHASPVIAVGKSAKQRRAEAAAAKPVVRKIWSGKIASIVFPAKKAEDKVNNRYAKVIVDLDNADKTVTYYFWLDKGWKYDLNGMVNAAVKVQIQRRKADGTAKCYPVDLADIKQHMLANKIPENHRAVAGDMRAGLWRRVTDPGSLDDSVRKVTFDFLTRQVAKTGRVVS